MHVAWTSFFEQTTSISSYRRPAALDSRIALAMRSKEDAGPRFMWTRTFCPPVAVGKETGGFSHRLHDPQHDRQLTDILELHFIELTKFQRDKPRDLRTPFEKWLHALKFGELYQEGMEPIPEVLAEEEGLEMALEAMRKACASDRVRELIEMRRKAAHDEATRLEDALERGREQGLEQGIERGREEGLERGRVETARSLRDAGVPLETILAATGLRAEDLEA